MGSASTHLFMVLACCIGVSASCMCHVKGVYSLLAHICVSLCPRRSNARSRAGCGTRAG